MLDSDAAIGPDVDHLTAIIAPLDYVETIRGLPFESLSSFAQGLPTSVAMAMFPPCCCLFFKGPTLSNIPKEVLNKFVSPLSMGVPPTFDEL